MSEMSSLSSKQNIPLLISVSLILSAEGGTQDKAHSFSPILIDLDRWITFFFLQLNEILSKEPDRFNAVINWTIFERVNDS